MIGNSHPNKRVSNIELDKIPHWDQHIIHELEDGREVIEVFLEQNSELFLKVGLNGINNNSVINSLLLFEDDKEDYKAFISRTYSDEQEINFLPKDLFKFNFLNVPQDFSGRRSIFDWDEGLIGG
ncbi:hypothetical protein [Belliella pelovolcani]|uniref:hypothetical protein n=1 Tax=Belliella pelovolcani TaxID=529505 RepID=UPI00391B90C9